jgi:Mg-chelatase subunit ChlD
MFRRVSFLAALAATCGSSPLLAAPPEVRDPKPNVEVVFCLDTTGSMSGLIEGAKQKIWSISNQIVAGKPSPNLRVGLLAYRDRGDAYVTKLTDLTDDLDAIYSNIKEYKADQGGDTPESVNQALNEAVTRFKWSDDKNTLKIIFLVGDAPPQMNYKDDVKYPETCKLAAEKGILINAVQCGTDAECARVWRDISSKAGGDYVQIAQDGATVRVVTPFDDRLATINAELENSTLVYGSLKRQAEVQEARLKALDGAKADPARPGAAKGAAPVVKVEPPKASTAKPGSVVPVTEGSGIGGGFTGAPGAPGLAGAIAADRAAFNAWRTTINAWDLLGDLKAKKVKLEDLKEEELPEELRKLPKDKRQAYLDDLEKKREKLREEARDLAKKRDEFTKKKLEEEGKKAKEGFDLKVEELLRKQAKKAGIDY